MAFVPPSSNLSFIGLVQAIPSAFLYCRAIVIDKSGFDPIARLAKAVAVLWCIATAGALLGCVQSLPQLSTNTVIEQALSSSVQLFTERPGGVRRAGSGVVIGYTNSGEIVIATAAHLIEPPVAQSLRILTPGQQQSWSGSILAVDSDADIALITGPQNVPQKPAEALAGTRLGQPIWVVSFPWGRQATVVNGVVSQVENLGQDLPTRGPIRLIDASVSYGTSGGGVFDAESGALVGLVRGYRTAKLSIAALPQGSLDVPIAGETTVTSTAALACLLQQAGLLHIQPNLATASACKNPAWQANNAR